MSQEEDEYIAQRIKGRRVVHNMTEEVFAGRLGRTVDEVQQIESAEMIPDASLLQDIAEVLGVGVDFFTDGFGPAGAENEEDEAELREAYETLSEEERNEVFDAAKKKAEDNKKKRH